MSETNTNYRTHDIYLAAALLTAGARLIGRQKSSGRMTFDFEHAAIDALVDAYILGGATVNARQYAENIKGIKNLLFRDGADQ